MDAYTNTFGTAGNDHLNAAIRPEMLFGGPGEDTLVSAQRYDSMLMGGTGSDIYSAGSRTQSTLVIETGNDPNDLWADYYQSWPPTIMATIDSRHLIFTTSSGSNTVIFVDWQKPSNIIEYWIFQNKSMSYETFVQTLYSSSSFYGDVPMDRFPAAYQEVLKNLINEAVERAAWYEGALRTSTTDPSVIISPTAGDDNLTATAGTEFVDGLGGQDTISGLGGNDTISGNAGHDVLYGNQGDDSLLGDGGNDVVFGGQGADTLYGGQDADVLYGQIGDDIVWGDFGDDTLYGGQGNDNLQSFGGPDVLYGNLGDDTLVGGTGGMLYGGGGADRFCVVWNGGNVTVADFNAAEGDRLRMSISPDSVGADAAGNAVVSFLGLGTFTLLGVAPSSFNTDWITH